MIETESIKLKPTIIKTKILIIVLAATVTITPLSLVIFHKSDEEKILDTLNSFAVAYSAGDTDALCDCLEPKLKAALKAESGIASSLLGIEISDIFTLLMGGNTLNAGEDTVKFEVKSMRFISDSQAEVKVIMYCTYHNLFTSSNRKDQSDESVNFIKVKNKWLIAND